MFYKGDRVNTPKGKGSIAYQRMAPPEFKQPAAVSVVLDSEKDRPGYTGTIFGGDDVGQVELIGVAND